MGIELKNKGKYIFSFVFNIYITINKCAVHRKSRSKNEQAKIKNTLGVILNVFLCIWIVVRA